METTRTEINEGEISIFFGPEAAGTYHLSDLGLTREELTLRGGNLRMVLNLGAFGGHFYKVPTLEIAFEEKIGETSWQVEFNGEVVLDKTDHSGHRTVLLLDRSRLEAHRHRHENVLILHGDLPQAAHISAQHSLVRIVEKPGT